MEELSCPRCRMTKYRNPALQLMINACGHPLCKSCVDVIFVRESAPCPECGRSLRRGGFRTQLFEDTRVDKEVDIRKMVMKIYNKLESDFGTLREYNDYLEEVEEIIWDLEMGRNEKETKEKMAEYKQNNEAVIRRNQVRFNQERAFFRDSMAREAKEKQVRAQLQTKLDKEAAEARRKVEEEFLRDLKSNSHLTAEELLERRRQFESQQDSKLLEVKTADIDAYVHSDPMDSESTSTVQQPTQFVYEAVAVDISGPELPDSREMRDNGYMRNIREATLRDVGGGYTSLMTCQRALCDAFGGLFATPESAANGVV